MDPIATRLTNCFQTVFPALRPEQIPNATQQTISGWDSTSAIMLVNVIEEEFGIEMDFDRLGELDSFESLHRYLLAEKQSSAAGM